MKKFLSILVALMAVVTLHAEVIDLGEMQLDSLYTLQDFKGYKGQFTASRSGVLTASSTTTDDMTAYSDAACTKPCPVTKNGLYGPHTYDLNVEAGSTYYFYIDFVMNSGTKFRLTMPESVELSLVNASPALNSTYSVSSSGQVSFNFNKAVAFTSASISIANGTSQRLAGQVSTNSIFFNDVQEKVWSAMNDGSANEGDDIKISVTGVRLASNSSVLYNGDGVFEAHYKVSKMPAILLSSEHSSGAFLSYYCVGDDNGVVKLHFSKPISLERAGAQIKYGNIDQEADGDYYVEYLSPTLADDGKTLLVNLQGKRRKASDMVATGTVYDRVSLGITGVMDTEGDYAYSSAQGSIGSYWFTYTYQEVTANVTAEFSPASGADISASSPGFEIWITDEEKLSYDGIEFTYEKENTTHTLTLSNSQILKESDPDEPSARILSFAVPAELLDAKNIDLSFKNLQCADGSDYSALLHARYNAFVISRTSPVAGATLERFTAGQEIKIYTNRDAMYESLDVKLVKASDNATLFEGQATPMNNGRGFVYTCADNRWLAKGSDYKLLVSGTDAQGEVSTDYVTYHGAAVKIEDLFYYGYMATGITLQDTLVSGNIKTATISGFSNSKHSGNHYALLSMPEAVSNTMDGCQITHIAFYPFLTSMTTARIVISNEIGGTPLYEQEVTGIASQTWCDVELSTPFTLKKDDLYYIGYVIESAAGDYPVGYYYTSNPAANAVVDPIIDWIAYEQDGTIKSGMLDAQMYAARRQTANLMLYATIEAPLGDLPKNGVAVGLTQLSNKQFVHPDEPQRLTCYYTNTGVANLESLSVKVTDGDMMLANQTITLSEPLAPMWEGSFTVNLSTSVVGLHKISVEFDEPNGTENRYTGQKYAEKNFLVYTDSIKRNVVLEHFTTGQCTNCVAGEQLVETELAKVNSDIDVIRINHHSGFGTDKLTTTDDIAYEWFYGGSYVWAPANMIDRTDLAAYGAKGYGGTATTGPVFGTDKSASIASLITAAAHLPAFVGLEVEASASDNRELTVTVHAEQLYEMPQAALMHLNVAVLQDSVVAPQKKADGTTDKNFVHDNVLRTNLTGTWGEIPTFTDNHLSRTFTYTVPAAWKMEKLRVVAFLADYDSSNTKNCNIYNAAATRVQTSSTALSPLTDEQPTDEEPRYNLFGQRVGREAKGLVIQNRNKYIIK